MFVDFFYQMRRRGLRVSITEYMTLLEALDKGLGRESLDVFYSLARSVLVKRVEDYDLWDRIFAEYFQDAVIDWEAVDIPRELLDWLQHPIDRKQLSAEELARLEQLDLDELRRRFAERLRQQDERHDGGSHWIGTGGSSPFGHGGSHPSGIRVGGEGSGGRAVQVAMKRRFRNLRNDLVLDVRQFEVALRKLRLLTRDGPEDELDLEETIDQTARNAGDIEMVFRRPRKNDVRLLLLCDVGGSMTPYSQLTSLLFSAAHKATHFKEFHSYYFHNCPYEVLYSDMERRKGVATQEVLDMVDQRFRCIIVGDAAMAPYELTERGGSIDLYHLNEESGLSWLQRIREALPRTVWLNPDPPRYWEVTWTTRLIGSIFPMYPLTLEGLDEAISELRKP